MADQDTTAMLAVVKNDLGITHNKKDSSLTTAIETAARRLSMIGVDSVNLDDPTTETAVLLFCRHWLNFQGDGERYLELFERLANAMSHASEYRALMEDAGDE